MDASNHQPVNNVTLNSTYQILGVFGNSSHIFVQVYTGNVQAMVVLTFESDTLQLVGEVKLSGPVLLWSVNAAGTLLVVAEAESDSATIVSASTGMAVAKLDGGLSDLFLNAVAYDATTDTLIVVDGNGNGSIFGIALNNTLLWTIAPSIDEAYVLDIAVDPQGRSLYVLAVAYTANESHTQLRFIQYDLTTHTEVERYDLVNTSLLPNLPLAAGQVDGEIYVCNAMDDTVARVSMTSGVEQSISLSRYPYWRKLSSVASLDGKSFTAYTTAPFELYNINADGVVQRRTLIAPLDACGNTNGEWQGENNIDIDMHGNIVVPLCSLGVRVYSPDHTLLHVICTPNNTQPTGVAVTPSGQYVYVVFSADPKEQAAPLS